MRASAPDAETLNSIRAAYHVKAADPRVEYVDMEILAVVHTLTSFYRVVWNYVYLLAELLPQVRDSEHAKFQFEISLTRSLQPPLDQRLAYHAGPEDLKLKYSLILDTTVIHCYAPHIRDAMV